MRILTLFLLLFSLPIYADTVSLRIRAEKDEDGVSREFRVFSRGDSRLLMSLKRFSQDGSLDQDTCYYTFDGKIVLTSDWEEGKGYSVHVEPKSPVMVRVYAGSDRMIDWITFEESVEGRIQVMSFFYTDELGMIPAVSTIVVNDKTVYEIDTSNRKISKIIKRD